MRLSIIAYEGKGPPVTGSADIGARGCAFGRGTDNDLVLVDPERLVSRHQARVERGASGYSLVNVSSANALLLNDREIGPGESSPVAPGDQIRVGRFVLGLAEDAAPTPVQAPAAAPPMPAATTPAASRITAREDFDPLAAFGAGGSDAGDPFADLLAPATAPPSAGATLAEAPILAAPPRQAAAPARPSDAPSELGIDLFAGLDRPAPETGAIAATPMPGFDAPLAGKALPEDILGAPESWTKLTNTPDQAQPARHTFIPEDFDPFALPSLARRNTDDPLGNIDTLHIDGLDDLLRDGQSTPENLLDDLPKAAAEPLPDTARLATPGSGMLDAASQADPLALFSEDSPFAMLDARGEDVANMRDSTPEISAAFELPRATPETRVPAPAAAAPTLQPLAPGVVLPNPGGPPPARPSGPGLDGAELLVAFYRGAGMADPPAQALSPEFMQLLGELLAIVAQGTVDLMQARAATKHELRAEVTLIAPQANNPLKFAPDGQAAMAQLVGKRFPGFMPPLEAMRDAFDDLRAHQVGMTAGMRAALQEVLTRFAPDNLEQRISQQSLLETVLPAARKSRLWDLYTDMYQQIKNEAEDEFHSLFGEAFLRTYGAEVARLAKRGKP